jgi:hypothetical protein
MTLDESIYIPYALYIDGLVVKLFDTVNHQLVAEDLDAGNVSGQLRGASRRDLRWKRISRPFIMTGGELTLAGLDLVFDDVNKYYEAPLQVKANGGILLIDDFGRQLVRPRDLLNRWIVPLENRIDYMTLHTGRKVEVPFDVLVTFHQPATERPRGRSLLRRLRHKIDITDPIRRIPRDFQQVAVQGCQLQRRRPAYLLQEWYIRQTCAARLTSAISASNLDIAYYPALF